MKVLCGIVIGILIAAAAGATLYYFCVLKKNPQMRAKGVQRIEKTWDKTKNTGDKAVDTLKSAAPAEEQE